MSKTSFLSVIEHTLKDKNGLYRAKKDILSIIFLLNNNMVTPEGNFCPKGELLSREFNTIIVLDRFGE